MLQLGFNTTSQNMILVFMLVESKGMSKFAVQIYNVFEYARTYGKKMQLKTFFIGCLTMQGCCSI